MRGHRGGGGGPPPPLPPPALAYDYKALQLAAPFNVYHNASSIISTIASHILSAAAAARPGLGHATPAAASSGTDDDEIPVAWIPDWFGYGEGIVGKSHQGANIYALVVGNATAERAVYVQGGLHAREWISPASLLGMLHAFRTMPTDATKALLKKVALYVVVMANPDGYDFSMYGNRMWRKNRNPNPTQNIARCPAEGIGVDLNRNWGAHFGGADADEDPCSNAYRGTEAFSEPETKAAPSRGAPSCAPGTAGCTEHPRTPPPPRARAPGTHPRRPWGCTG